MPFAASVLVEPVSHVVVAAVDVTEMPLHVVILVPPILRSTVTVPDVAHASRTDTTFRPIAE